MKQGTVSNKLKLQTDKQTNKQTNKQTGTNDMSTSTDEIRTMYLLE